MDAKTWLTAQLRLAEIEQASPHLTLKDPGTGTTTYFDAGAECLTRPCLPSNWDGTYEEWDEYANFLLDFYGTDDWQNVYRHLVEDEVIPVWTEGRIEMVCRGDDNIYRPCDEREHNPESAQEVKKD